MMPKQALIFLLIACASGAACKRVPEPSGFEQFAQASPAEPLSAASAGAAIPNRAAQPTPQIKADNPPPSGASDHSKIEHVIIVAMENHDAPEIYDDPVNAPYIHELVEQYARTENFEDELPLEVPSEGHYVWMEAGTHQFSDVTFTGDDPPSPSISTGSDKHLVTQIRRSKSLTWMSYQEGLNAETGACPIFESGFYVPKHNPFVFFRDLAGDPPSKDAAYCAAHHKPYSALAGDLAGNLASYVFITPDECHDMHWQRGCPAENPIRTGDRWLKAELPQLLAFANQHSSVIFITFDEGGSTLKLPFLALGPMIKPHYLGKERYTHSSQLKTVELILGLPPLKTVASANDLSDLFKPGMFP